MHAVEQSKPRSYREERDMVVPIVTQDREKCGFFSQRLAKNLDILLEAYTYRDKIGQYRTACALLEKLAYPEYLILTRRVDLLLKKQEALHSKVLEITQVPNKRKVRWRKLSQGLHSFRAIKTKLTDDLKFADIFFDPDKARTDILHDLAVRALRGIPWDAYNIPECVREDWRLLYGIGTWQGNFQKITVFDLRDAEERLRREFTLRYPHGYKPRSGY